jgi:hypothetical protein
MLWRGRLRRPVRLASLVEACHFIAGVQCTGGRSPPLHNVIEFLAPLLAFRHKRHTILGALFSQEDQVSLKALSRHLTRSVVRFITSMFSKLLTKVERSYVLCKHPVERILK